MKEHKHIWEFNRILKIVTITVTKCIMECNNQGAKTTECSVLHLHGQYLLSKHSFSVRLIKTVTCKVPLWQLLGWTGKNNGRPCSHYQIKFYT